MSIKNKFHIPSAAEMEKETRSSSDSVSGTNPSSLFSAHRKTLQSNIAREKNTKSTLKVTGPKTTTTAQNESGAPRPSVIDSCATSSRQLHEVTKSQQGIFPHTANSKGTAKSNPVNCDQSLKTFSLRGESNKVAEKNFTSGASTGDNASTSCEGNKGSPSRPGNIHAIIVSARQRGNPVLKYIRNVPWEFGDLVADYQMGQSTCALFLSLRYHNLNPNYIHERLKQLGHSYNLRILLVQVDIKDPTHCICELAKMCILADCTLILAFTAEEAGKYLETYKSFETKPPDLIMEKTEGNFIARMTDALTTVKSVNKTDANTLQNTFGSLEKVVEASEEDLSFCPGFGPQKAKRLHSVFQEPFLREKKRKFSESPVKGSPTKLCAPRSGSSKGKPS